jgi:GTP-binding protein YchF
MSIMSLSCGLVGLPNSGKSTLFNALLQKQQALVAAYPFTTIEPNMGIVPVPDPNLKILAKAIQKAYNLPSPPPQIPATIKFIDIAGLVKDAHQGEGLGNQFLSHIRETDLVCHILRSFSDDNVAREGAVDPVSDLKLIRTELLMADLATLEKQKSPRLKVNPDQQVRWLAIKKLTSAVRKGQLASQVSLSPEEKELTHDLFLLTAKPELFVINVDEADLRHPQQIISDFISQTGVGESQVIVISAQLESELSALNQQEKEEYLKDINIKQSGLQQLIKSAYSTLNLISFYTTTGNKEVRAWPLRRDSTAYDAAGIIHTDFQTNFIKAAVCPLPDFINSRAWPGCKSSGKLRHEGKDYQIQDQEVVEFITGS